jgi:hypothetical protein
MIGAFLIGLGALWIATGLYIFVAPSGFYENTPGLKLMGPFSVHFIRDVGLAFIASGAVLAWGSLRGERALAVAGLIWPLLHGAFHVQIWAHRGFPFDGIFAFDVAAVISPPVLAVLAAQRLTQRLGSRRA